MLDSYCVKLLYNFSLMLYMCSQVEWVVGVFACVSFCLFTGQHKTQCRNGSANVCVFVCESDKERKGAYGCMLEGENTKYNLFVSTYRDFKE